MDTRMTPWQQMLNGSFSNYPWMFDTSDGGIVCESCAQTLYDDPETRDDVVGGGELSEGETYCDECGKHVCAVGFEGGC